MRINLKKILYMMIILILIIVFWIIWGNTALELNTITINSTKLPSSFSGFKIAHVSDLHNAEFGNNNETLLKMLLDSNPDIIAITGDLIDSRRTNIEIALKFARESVKIAPTYYVTGNHESRINEYEALMEGLIQAGVIILQDESIILKNGEETINLIGLKDPDFSPGNAQIITDTKLKELIKDDESFSILLSHRPELFEVYVENKISLALSGHAHGGQFRLPIIGGLFAPHQGLLPKYDGGLYTTDDTNMVVSRGLGNSLFPFRINNRPEILLIILER